MADGLHLPKVHFTANADSAAVFLVIGVMRVSVHEDVFKELHAGSLILTVTDLGGIR